MENLDNKENLDNQSEVKQPFITRKIEKFKQKTTLDKIVSVIFTIIGLTILFTIISFIVQVSRITSIIKLFLNIIEMLLGVV